MYKLLSMIATVVAIALPQVVQANDGLYVGGMAGVNFLDVHAGHHKKVGTKAGYTLGGVVGYKFCDDFRLEGEISYRNNSYKHLKYHSQKVDLSGNTKAWSFMANGYYDLPVQWVVTPYVGAGIGYDKFCGKAASAKVSDEGFAWQVMTGVNYDLCQGVQVNLEYKFHEAFLRKNAKTFDNALTLGVKKFF